MRTVPLNVIEPISDMRSLIELSARRYTTRTVAAELAQDGTPIKISYAAFEQDVHALGNALLAHGWGTNRIGLIGENSYAWLLAYFAIVGCGATVVPFDKELSCDELHEQMQRARISVMCHTSLYEPEAQAAAKLCNDERAAGSPALLPLTCIDLGSLAHGKLVPALMDEGRAMTAAGDDPYSRVSIDPQSCCSILFTSGTTGISKGVMLSHKNLATNTHSACQLVRFEPTDVLVSLLPISHAYEDMCGIFGPIYYGSMIALCPGLKSLPRYLEVFAPTIMVLVPLVIETFHDKIVRAARAQHAEKTLTRALVLSRAFQYLGLDISARLLAQPRAALGGRLRIVISGGAALDASYVRFFRGLGVNILQGYGITECSPIISANRNQSNREGSVGWIAPCCELKCDDQGQILVKGDHVMLGYLDDEEATQAAFVDGWFATGDLGHVDADRFLYVDGRCKDIIVLTNGKNIMPQQIEALIARDPLVTDVIVCEGAHNTNGAVDLAALIYPDWDAGLDERELRERIHAAITNANRELAAYKRVAHFSLRKEPFAKTTMGKVRRFMITAPAEKASSTEPTQKTKTQTQNDTEEIWDV